MKLHLQNNLLFFFSSEIFFIKLNFSSSFFISVSLIIKKILDPTINPEIIIIFIIGYFLVLIFLMKNNDKIEKIGYRGEIDIAHHY